MATVPETPPFPATSGFSFHGEPDQARVLVPENGGQEVVPCLNEAQMAQWQREQGFSVIQRRGRYWVRSHLGFYEPVHWLACWRGEETERPSWRAWGFRSTLHRSARHLANASMPVHLLSDVPGYRLEALPAKRRTDLRKCRKQVTIVSVREPTQFQIEPSQWYGVGLSAALRTGHSLPCERDQYLAELEPFLKDKRRLVLAGLVKGSLAGYLSGYAVEGVAYVESVVIATEHLPTAIGTGLVFEFVQACQRSLKVQQIVYGQHSLEDSKLNVFKTGMGFPVVQVPCRVWLLPLLSALIRWRRPYKFYRLTGVSPGGIGKAERQPTQVAEAQGSVASLSQHEPAE